MLRFRTRFLNRYTAVTAMALFAILAGQIAVAGHAAVADHDIGEQCEVCIGADRLGHGPADAAATALPPAPQPAIAAPVAAALPCFLPRYRYARAPPIL
jgi:hypothetical protein